MSSFSAGNFTITVSSPYPCYFEIAYQGKCIHGIRHSEIADLGYVLQRAIASAKLKLKDDSNEIGV